MLGRSRGQAADSAAWRRAASGSRGGAPKSSPGFAFAQTRFPLGQVSCFRTG